MPNDTAENRVRKIIATVFDLPLDSVTLNSSKDNIKNWDSMGIINIMVALESEFGVTIDVDEAVNLQSIKEIIIVLKNKGVN